ncbi:MAG: DUF2892 domain-containing protein [Spirochaetae bacterium HGW-Spirochaetae-7]|nr:MAG: DUF2892 domain-containing protein [Spirochaetae bacterium HGW-Spirochaetae-7]
MIKNMGLLDRLLRIAFAIMVAAMYLTGQISGKAAIVLGLIALIMVITSLAGTCLLYIPFKLDSHNKKA